MKKTRYQNISKQHRAGSRKQKREARLDKKAARRNERRERQVVESPVGIAQNSAKAGEVVEVLITHPENLDMSRLSLDTSEAEVQARVHSMSTLLDHTTSWARDNLETIFAEPGLWVLRIDEDDAMPRSVGDRFRRWAKKYDRPVAVGVKNGEVRLTVGGN